MTTWLLGRPEPIVTYSNDLWNGRIIRPGIYSADGMTMCVRENPDYGG